MKQRFFLGLGGENVHRNHEMWLFQMLGGLEALAIGLSGLFQHLGGKMRSKGIGQPQMRRQLRAIKRGSQDPDRNIGIGPGNGAQALAVLDRAEIGHQFEHVARESVLLAHVAAQGAGGFHVGAGRAPQAQVDAGAVDLGQGAELFCNDQGRMIGQHHPAGPDPDARGRTGDMSDQDRGRRRGNAGHVVMLGQPVAVIALGLGELRKGHGIGDRLAGRGAFGDRGEV